MIQMPALNTPQFRWVRSRLPNEAQTVPPIFQPEVAAEAILHCIEHPRREMYVGWPAVKAIVGNKIAPGFSDWYLAQNGFQSQQTDEPRDRDRPDNLWEPADETEDHGAHGVFADRARSSSPQLWATEHRGLLAAGALAAGVLALLGGRALADDDYEVRDYEEVEEFDSDDYENEDSDDIERQIRQLERLHGRG
jgi:hypothetical protein